MPQLQEKRILPYDSKAMFELVLDIENYPQFLPWCIGAKITKRLSARHLHAELMVEFKGLKESYLSDVSWQISEKSGKKCFFVEAVAIRGPFKNLLNHWEITEIDEKSCEIKLFLNFEFNSVLLNKLLGGIFLKASQKMIEAFEQRAKIIHNPQ